MNKRDAHKGAMYLIKNYTDNWQYDIARGCAEMARGIGIISDDEYGKACQRIEKAKESFHIF